jgi:hypothetical protein
MAIISFEPSFPRFDPEIRPTHNGFDPDGPWQMVPYRDSRYLHLNLVGVKDWSVEPVNPYIVSVSRVAQPAGVDPVRNNVCEVVGLHPGRTSLIARGPKGEQLGKLEVEVKTQRKLFIRFFLVSDNAGHKTTFSEKDTKAWTEFLNDEVFGPQVNVRFQYLSTGPVTIYEDLGDRIDFSAIGMMPYVKRNDGEASRIWHMITDAGMLHPEVFNVFCVWDFLNRSMDGQDHAAFVASKVRITADEMEKFGVNYNMCMLRENVPGHGFYDVVLAHEAGHYLNRLPFHTTGDGLLMTPGGAGIRLQKADARRMNPAP